ncbi:MAG TPA: prepilin-type N-terminal cleavage/methylation domain-containing protein [Myxococcota bacterium]|jgi:prepilin-type N-terminal cleavage/methylation domain-containing protein|nr:prepilin-type N-terminal cleavage/methylation domain-containing protein [Myxococcota bacterium]
MQARKRRTGFTLIEMMITTAIIGILAAIAVPGFALFQARSRRSESFTNLSAIGRSEDAYYAESGTYVSTATSQPGHPFPWSKVVWTAAADTDFSAIGWRPEGAVYYDYAVNACTAARFTASAYGDVDNDGVVAYVLLARPDSTGADCSDLLLGVNPVDSGGNPVHNEPLTWPELVVSGKF